MKSFKDFTNLYSLSKTLRFELKPHPLTKSLTEVIKKDKEIDRLYNEDLKPMLDALHEEFITESLNRATFPVNDLERLEENFNKLIDFKQKLKNLNRDKEKKQELIKNIQVKITELENEKSGIIPKLQSNLRQVIVNSFAVSGAEWKEKYEKEGIKFKSDDDNKEKQGWEMLTTKGVLEILKSKHSKYPKKVENIGEFNSLFTYFKGFNQNRANYYTSDQKATGVANRIINVNLTIFLKNKKDFALFLEKLHQLESYKGYFELRNFQNYLTQKDIELYNEKIGEIKKLVNLEYNQKVKDKKDIVKGLTKLQKQIGCKKKQEKEQLARGESIYPRFLEKVGLGFHITKDREGHYQIWESLAYLNEKLIPQIKKVRNNYRDFFANWQDYQLGSIWFRKESLNTISSRWFGGDNWFVLTRALAYLGTGKIDTGEYKPSQFVSLQELKEAMEALENGVDFDVKKSKKKIDEVSKEDRKEEATKQYFYKPDNLFRDEYKNIYAEKTLFEAFLAIWQHEVELNFKKVFDGYTDKEGGTIKSFLQNFEKQKKDSFDKNKKEHVSVVFDFMQKGYLPILQMTKYHNLEKKGEIVPGYNADDKFYEALYEFWEDNLINQYRNALEATLTQKPYSEDKIKLNFDCGYLLGGWSPDYETYGALILKKDNRFYLILINGTGLNNEEVKTLYQNISDENRVERLIYSAQKLDHKNFPRWFINSVGNRKAPAVAKYNLPIDLIWDDYQDYRKLNDKDKKKYLEDNPVFRSRLIDYYKHCLPFHEDVKAFKDNFIWKEAKEYKNLNAFYADVVNSCYKISWEAINFNALKDLVKKGRIYLFQIYNKDFELDSDIGKKKYGENYKTKESISLEKGEQRGEKNLHTQLFLELLKPDNAKYLKLLGGGEIFFRDPSKEKTYKTDRKGRNVLKAPRYYEEKCFLHFPVEIKKQREANGSFNQEVWKTLAQNKSMKVIGIDRGEKHLMYYSVVSIDEKGKFKLEEQGSFNRIETKNPVDEKKLECGYDDKGKLEKVELVSTGKQVNYVDYHLLLDYYEKKRRLARETWEVIAKIKDLKEGYLSQVIHKIYKLVLKHNAIVVMENLSGEFKAKRGAKVEKAVYKKFELALAKKLSHLVLKDKQPFENGGILQPYQLTPPIQPGKIGDFEKVNQWGIIFYVQPHYTSTTDPITGWRKHLYISNNAPIERRKDDNGKSKEQNTVYIKDFFNSQSGVQINYDFDKECFKFSYQDEYGKSWNLHAYPGLSRFYFDSQEKKVKPYDLHKEFDNLFFNLKKNKNINGQLFEQSSFNWKRLVFLWNLLNQIRNTDKSKEGNENDFIQSAHWFDRYKCFFDSREIRDRSMPDNGDSNGAYNIARKGLILLNKIEEHAKDDPEFKKSLSLSISNQEWDKAVGDWNGYISKL